MSGGRETIVFEPASIYQLRLPIEPAPNPPGSDSSLDVAGALEELLRSDLTFKGQKTAYATHNLHPFAAKFPPQLPRLFINALTRPGECVCDPMAGSGTTLVEAVLAGRKGIGVDIDPLASLLITVKSTSFDLIQCDKEGKRVLQHARRKLTQENIPDSELLSFYAPQVVSFFRYWFEDHTINELYPLIRAIMAVEDVNIRVFLQVVFSSVIITKSGGVTRARDLAHSRPHRDLNKRVCRNAQDIFAERLESSLAALASIEHGYGQAYTVRADARRLPLVDNCMHLIITSPPYAANAIDYMRAHKFSLMWFGYPPDSLSVLRSRYIGAERRASTSQIPSETACRVLHDLKKKDERRAEVVAYYYRDLEAGLKEMLRVTATGRAAVIVVGSSTICQVGIKVPAVTAELAEAVGFRLVGLARREIVRDARMMPVSHKSDRNGIEARMHEEGVIGLVKP